MIQVLLDIIGIWDSGGWVMLPLCVLALLIYITGFEMLLFLRSYNIKINADQNLNSWIIDPNKAPKLLEKSFFILKKMLLLQNI